MEIKTEKYSVTYDSTTATVICEGSLLLNGSEEYEPILQLLKTAAEQQEHLIVDLRTLKFLNSSGINMMTKFVVHVSDMEKSETHLTVISHKNVAWQEKLSKNLKRLMPTLQARLE